MRPSDKGAATTPAPIEQERKRLDREMRRLAGYIVLHSATLVAVLAAVQHWI